MTMHWVCFDSLINFHTPVTSRRKFAWVVTCELIDDSVIAREYFVCDGVFHTAVCMLMLHEHSRQIRVTVVCSALGIAIIVSLVDSHLSMINSMMLA